MQIGRPEWVPPARRAPADRTRRLRVSIGDDLFSRPPLCQAELDTGGHFIFVCLRHCDELWRAARAKLGPRYNCFSRLAAMTS
jgi:hypothetical protein